MRLLTLGAAASAVTAWGLRGGTPAEGRAAAAFGTAAAVNAGVLAFTMLKIMPVNDRLLPEGLAEKEEGQDGIMWLLKKASRTAQPPALSAVWPDSVAYGNAAIPLAAAAWGVWAEALPGADVTLRLLCCSGASCTACAQPWGLWRWAPPLMAPTSC